jgi:hypothetical protein
VLFLGARAGKTKASKSAHEAEYRAVLDALVADCAAVLFWPEWPAAATLLGVVCKAGVGALDDAGEAGANAAARGAALDHLGVIAARLRTSQIRCAGREGKVLPLDEVGAWAGWDGGRRTEEMWADRGEDGRASARGVHHCEPGGALAPGETGGERPGVRGAVRPWLVGARAYTRLRVHGRCAPPRSPTSSPAPCAG